MRNLFVFALTLLFVSAVSTSLYAQEQKKGGPWTVPDNYKKMKNTYKAGDAEALKIGKMLYAKHCKSCHGNNGEGDGPKAKQLKTFPGDFTAKDFKATPDGNLYYMSFVGRDEMPNYEKKVTTDEDRWAIVTYIKSLTK